jgi:hypothetical protein
LFVLLVALPARAITLHTGDVLNAPMPSTEDFLSFQWPLQVVDDSGTAVTDTAIKATNVAVSGSRVLTCCIGGLALRDLSLNVLWSNAHHCCFVAVDDANRVYAGYSTDSLAIINADGSLNRTIAVPGAGPGDVDRSFSAIDVSPDGCTLWYQVISSFGAYRYDLCHSQPLANPLPRDDFQTIRALRDGGLAGASLNSLRFYNAAFHLIHTIAIPDLATAFAFSADGQFVWLSTQNALYEIRISDGACTLIRARRSQSLAVIGERRPSIAEIPGDVSIPAVSPYALMALSVMLTAIALRSLR